MPTPLQAPRRLLHRAWAGALLALLVACGGGGGGGGLAPAVQAAGIWGSVHLPDQHLGRIAEREPNDVLAQAYPLPPAFARTTLDVAGNVASTAAWYGNADAADVLRYRVLASSDVTLSLEHRAIDPSTGGVNALLLEVRDAQGTLLASDDGGSPTTAAVRVAGGAPLFVHVVALAGTTPYVITFTASDPALPPAPPAPPKPSAPGVAPGVASTPLDDDACSQEHVLVRLHPGVDAAAWAERHGHVLGEATASGTCRVKLAPSGSEARKAAKGFAVDPEVAWSEPDWRVVPLGAGDDARVAQQWGLRAVGAYEAWDVTRGDPSIVVAVLDSGIVAHADLAGQTVPGYDFVSDAGPGADGDARDPDPTDPGDRGASNGLSLWHGTHVAGLIGARADGAGVAGLAPGCRIMPLRVLGRNGGYVSDVADALLFAAGLYTTADGRRLPQPLRVANLSLGMTTPSTELEQACDAALAQGMLVVAASGNGGGPVYYPAAYPSVLAVTAVDAQLRGTAYSSRGPAVALCAPGGFSLLDADGDGWPDGVLSCGRDETLYPPVDGHLWLTGTSAAAPHVAASAALLLSVDPSLSPTDLRALLEQSALDLGLGGRDDLHGWGLVQVATALKRLLESSGAPLLAPRLHLPVSTLRFVGLESLRRIPLRNVGGGSLTFLAAQSVTDDGGDWLGADLIASFPGDDVSASHLDVLIDRSRLPAGAGWSSGTLRLTSPTGGVGIVRVIVAANGAWPRAGSPLRVVPIDIADGGAPSTTQAHPEHDYRYVLGLLSAATYNVRAGEDLDADGFACEPFDICGWYGGLTQATALPVDFEEDAIIEAIDVTIGLAPPP